MTQPPSERARAIADRLDALTVEADALATDAHALADDLASSEVPPPSITGDVSMPALHIAAGDTFSFDPKADTTLTITEGSVLAEGTLRMRPASPDVTHRLIFAGVDEAAFVGGGMGPVDVNDPVLQTDRGLWCMRSCDLDIHGAVKTAWTNLVGSALAGGTTLELGAPAEGWQIGDEVAIAPTAAGVYHDGFEVRVVTSVNGSTVGLDQPLESDHPAVTTPWGRTWTAEVMNLTRNVNIEGTAAGRAHMFIHSDGPQTIKWAATRYLGPRQDDGTNAGHSVVGRWPLHFHHMGDASRGSVVEGMVGRELGSHAFVPHASHGTTFENNVAFDVRETPYWWDFDVNSDESHDTIFNRDIAALVRMGDKNKKGKNAGWLAVRGEGNRLTNFVAVGVQASTDGGGAVWNNIQGSDKWVFRDVVLHNHARSGVHLWQNPPEPFPIENLQVYNVGGRAFLAGAYGNGYQVLDAEYWNAGEGIIAKAGSSPPQPWMHVDGRIGNVGTYPIRIADHNNDQTEPAYFLRMHIYNPLLKAVLVNEGSKLEKGWYRFVEVVIHDGSAARDLEPSDFELVAMRPGSKIEVQRSNGTAYRIDDDFAVIDIPTFYP